MFTAKDIEKLEKANQSYVNNYIGRFKIDKYQRFDDFCDVYWINDDKVHILGKDGFVISEFDNILLFCIHISLTMYDVLVIDIDNDFTIEYGINHRYLKNNTLWFSNFKGDEIILAYVFYYIHCNKLIKEKRQSINHIKSIRIPIIPYQNQKRLIERIERRHDRLMEELKNLRLCND